jgi:hypothetical protein
MSNITPIGKHWRGPNLVDLSRVKPVEKILLLEVCTRAGVNFRPAARAIIMDRDTDKVDPSREIVTVCEEIGNDQRLCRESVRRYYDKKGLTSLSQQLLLEMLCQPKIIPPSKYYVLVGISGDCFSVTIESSGSSLCTTIEQVLPGNHVSHSETWLMQRAIKTYYEGGK